jgi:hypothetical protein
VRDGGRGANAAVAQVAQHHRAAELFQKVGAGHLLHLLQLLQQVGHDAVALRRGVARAGHALQWRQPQVDDQQRRRVHLHARPRRTP